jgi:hypothetical protein
MTKHNYLFNFDFFLCNPTPFLDCWIVIAPNEYKDQPNAKKKKKKFLVALSKWIL